MRNDASDSYNERILDVARPGVVVRVRRASDRPALRECLDDPDAFLVYSKILKDSRSTKAGVATLTDGSKVFIKRYNPKGVRYLARHIFRQARPFRVWEASIRLEDAGVDTPIVQAAMARRVMRLLVSAYLVTDAVSDAIPDDGFFKSVLLEKRRRHEFCLALASHMAAMHGAGVIHGDCKLSNFYFPAWRSGSLAMGVWDLDGARRHASAPRSGRTTDLARLMASLCDRAHRLGDANLMDDLTDVFSIAYSERSGCSIKPEALRRAAEGYSHA